MDRVLGVQAWRVLQETNSQPLPRLGYSQTAVAGGLGILTSQ
jgi:hypothetical protein